MRLSVCFLSLALSLSSLPAPASYEWDIAQWREESEKRLRAPEGWLALTGLFWLKAGSNTIGSAGRVRLTKTAPPKIGTLEVSGGSVSFKAASHAVKINGKSAKPGTTYPVVTDIGPSPTKFVVGTAFFEVIDRDGKLGVRAGDTQNPKIRNFAGRNWYPVENSFKVKAQWVPLDPPMKIEIPNVLGTVANEELKGRLDFELAGQKLSLYPSASEQGLFIIFKDKTSGKTTYGASRFLTASVPVDGTVELDFNRAYNPPCAFTAYATCPLAPKENVLTVEVTAGEKTPPRH